MNQTAPTREVKCKCQHCDQPLAFDALQAGTATRCPHCGVETWLFIPEKKPGAAAVFRTLFLAQLVIGIIACLFLFLIWRKQGVPPPRAQWQYSSFTFTEAIFTSKQTGEKLQTVLILSPYFGGVGEVEPQFASDAESILTTLGRDGWELCWSDGQRYLVKRPSGEWMHNYFHVSYRPYKP